MYNSDIIYTSTTHSDYYVCLAGYETAMPHFDNQLLKWQHCLAYQDNSAPFVLVGTKSLTTAIGCSGADKLGT